MCAFCAARLTLALCLILPLPSRAQETSKSRDFTFTSEESVTSTKKDRYCLPREENLISVKNVFVAQSNAKATISVNPDLTSNCIDMIVQLPPAVPVCTDIPKVTSFPPQVTFQKECKTVPTTVRFSLSYESRPAPSSPRP